MTNQIIMSICNLIVTNSCLFLFDRLFECTNYSIVIQINYNYLKWSKALFVAFSIDISFWPKIVMSNKILRRFWYLFKIWIAFDIKLNKKGICTKYTQTNFNRSINKCINDNVVRNLVWQIVLGIIYSFFWYVLIKQNFYSLKSRNCRWDLKTFYLHRPFS